MSVNIANKENIIKNMEKYYYDKINEIYEEN
jgi:hypothetical protein